MLLSVLSDEDGAFDLTGWTPRLVGTVVRGDETFQVVFEPAGGGQIPASVVSGEVTITDLEGGVLELSLDLQEASNLNAARTISPTGVFDFILSSATERRIIMRGTYEIQLTNHE